MDQLNLTSNQALQNRHRVIICDQQGINEGFKLVISYLRNDRESCISFIYMVESGSHCLFEKELTILEKRFSSSFILHLLVIDPDSREFNTDIIESVINSNVSAKMEFSVFGSEEFTGQVGKFLLYLAVDRTSIKTQTINQ